VASGSFWPRGGCPRRGSRPSTSPTGRKFLASVDLPSDAVERIAVALGIVDTLERQIHELQRALRRIARDQAGYQALITQYGIGELIALTCPTPQLALDRACERGPAPATSRGASADVGKLFLLVAAVVRHNRRRRLSRPGCGAPTEEACEAY
jgi:hypothetical protein